MKADWHSDAHNYSTNTHLVYLNHERLNDVCANELKVRVTAA